LHGIASREAPENIIEYDPSGRLLSQFDESAGQRIEYGYDKSGLRSWMKRGGTSVRYSYGADGELSSVIEDSGASVVFSYDVVGRETQRDYGNGIRIETGYDELGRMTFIRESHKRTGEITRAKGYVYDQLGRYRFVQGGSYEPVIRVRRPRPPRHAAGIWCRRLPDPEHPVSLSNGNVIDAMHG
jgi:YD repeat-containing protein